MEGLSWSEQALGYRVHTPALPSGHLGVLGLPTWCLREPRRSYKVFLTQPWTSRRTTPLTFSELTHESTDRPVSRAGE